MRILVVVVVVGVIACGAKDTPPDVERLVDQCLVAIEQSQELDAELTPWTICPGLFRQPGCRDAIETTSHLGRRERETAIATACRDAYCPTLSSPLPEVCSTSGQGWPETPENSGVLLAAALHHELGDHAWRVAAPMPLHFIATASRAEAKLQRALREPIRVNVPPASPRSSDPASTFILTVGTEEIFLNGDFIARTAEVAAQEGDTVAALRDALVDADTDAQLVIHADKDASHAVVVRLMSTAKDVGLSRIAIATRP